MMKIRTKITTLMTFLAMLLAFTWTGCSGGDSQETAAEQLLRATKDGNQKLAKLLDANQVVTAEIVVDILTPIHAATEEWNADLVSWEASPPDEKYMAKEVETFRKSSVELDRLLARLDSIGFAVGSEELCTDEPVPTTPTTTIGDAIGSDYGWRYACYAGCTAASAACTAACMALIVPPLTVGSPLIVTCLAACATASGACINECSMLKCW